MLNEVGLGHLEALVGEIIAFLRSYKEPNLISFISG